MPDSCFADRLGDLIALTPGEHAALAMLEERERRLRRGAMLISENDRLSELFVLKQGLMMSYVLLDDGRRQILRFLYPGDLLASSSLAYGRSPETIMALTEAVVSPFERSMLARLVVEHPRIAGVLMAIDQIERAALTDRLAAIGRTSAKARVAALLLEIRNRLRSADPTIRSVFQPGVTQEEMGDATGLTAVHVNRMLRQLEQDGLITRDSGQFTFINEQRLTRTANFVDRYADADLGWLPPPR